MSRRSVAHKGDAIVMRQHVLEGSPEHLETETHRLAIGALARSGFARAHVRIKGPQFPAFLVKSPSNMHRFLFVRQQPIDRGFRGLSLIGSFATPREKIAAVIQGDSGSVRRAQAGAARRSPPAIPRVKARNVIFLWSDER